jgi:hypothetical protein
MTLCFAHNTSSQTKFTCKECAREKWGDRPHTKDGVMMMERHVNLDFVRCDNCERIIRDLNRE